jgi:transcriptional regulator with AAA-type ATPase domain
MLTITTALLTRTVTAHLQLPQLQQRHQDISQLIQT